MGGLALLAEARSAGLPVAAEGGLLVIRGPRRSESIALRLLDHKAEILPLVSESWRGELANASEAFVDAYEERAGILEFDAGMDWEAAERRAYEMTMASLDRPVTEDFIVGALDTEPFDSELFDLMDGKPFS